MIKGGSVHPGSLDMLLDTMCNTFGGVCFIALMVAIISATLPSVNDLEIGDECIEEQMIVNKETARLMRERDELKAAIATQKSFVEANTSNGNQSLSEAQMLECVSSNAVVISNLKNEKVELEDKLAKLTTDVSYSVREAMRLERVLKELEEKLGNPANMRNRAVRTPVERELMGYKSLDVWLKDGRMYCLWNNRHVDCKTRHGANGLEWDYSIRPYTGFELNEAFFSSSEYLQMIGLMSGKIYMRIYSDSYSFPQLCMLRDDLIRRRKLYNWHVSEEAVMHFVEGYDGRVQ